MATAESAHCDPIHDPQRLVNERKFRQLREEALRDLESGQTDREIEDALREAGLA